jgi:(p)ppGpp synthase/HD superfamily hydrolase
MNIREKALEFATKAHEGQFRKGSGLPYITHPIAVAEIALELKKTKDKWEWVDEDILYVGALLHDTVEDVDWVTLEMIKEEFGIQAYWIVQDLTKIEGENYLTAILRAKKYIYSRLIKIADNTHNSSDLKEGTLKDKYRLSKYILEN